MMGIASIAESNDSDEVLSLFSLQLGSHYQTWLNGI